MNQVIVNELQKQEQKYQKLHATLYAALMLLAETKYSTAAIDLASDVFESGLIDRIKFVAKHKEVTHVKS